MSLFIKPTSGAARTLRIAKSRLALGARYEEALSRAIGATDMERSHYLVFSRTSMLFGTAPGRRTKQTEKTSLGDAETPRASDGDGLDARARGRFRI